MAIDNLTVEERIRVKVEQVYRKYGHVTGVVRINPADYDRLHVEFTGDSLCGFTQLHLSTEISQVRILAESRIPIGHVSTDRPWHSSDDDPWTIKRSVDYGKFTIDREAMEASRKVENEKMNWKIGTQQADNAYLSGHSDGKISFRLSRNMTRAEWKDFVSKVNELFDIAEEDME